MGEFTYETETRKWERETYEWDNVWWEHTERTDVPRVLYIGDSISCAARRMATAASENTIYFDGLGTSKALDNPFFPGLIHMFAAQQGQRKAVLFNNGLHGWHLDDETEYAQHYEQMIRVLLSEFEGTPVVLLLTTHVANPDRDKRVQARNRVVKALAEKYNLPTIDLYTLTKEGGDLLSGDGVHLKPEGYQLLSACLVENVRKYTAE